MIKTLVSIEVDLASSLAIRLACQLGGLMDMEIQPVYVKESSPHESAMGAGWASRTWEKELIQQGRAEISELISAEKDFCPVLREPRVVYGDRELELFKIVQGEAFDIFIEGSHFVWNSGEIHKRLRTKLYQRIPFPVILVRSLRKVDEVQLLCLDAHATQVLTKVFQKIWTDCPVPLVLNFPATPTGNTEKQTLRDAVDQASHLLMESGCAVSVRDTLPPRPNGTAQALQDQGLVALAVERGITKDRDELQWLNEVKASALLAFY